ncbi:MAG TPA: cohesin domain-containing protein [bacterium]|nr:cohesin domain-containing protein [bacterium]
MAQIYFSIPSGSISVGSTFEVGVFLDTQSQSIAAVESAITLPDGLKVVDIRDGNSLVNFWVARPEAGLGPISFSGVIPGGFVGERGELFTLVITAEQVGEMRIESFNDNILLNDGLGTRVAAVPGPIGFAVVAADEVLQFDAPTDVVSPELFAPVLFKQDATGEWYLAFAAQDKSSGIDHYEVREGWSRWVTAESPYRLQHQGLSGKVFVKAVDEAGNMRVVDVAGSGSLLGPLGLGICGILALFLMTILVVQTKKRLWPTKRRRSV